MQCVVAGAGYVGLTTALVLVEKGHMVTLVDIDEARAHRIAAGEAPFTEAGVEAALKAALGTGRLSTGTDLAAASATAEAIVLCVGTPSKPKGDADLSFVKNASKPIGRGVRRSKLAPLVVVRSTVPPGTAVELVSPTIARASHQKEGEGFHIVSNPEFLREGRALDDARRPDRIVAGALMPQAVERLREMWASPDTPWLATDPTTAELIKYASNAFLATKISFANELANLCADLGIDVYDVMQGVGMDPRIGGEFLRAGAGFGGSCFPKDVRALDRFARRRRAALRIPRAVLDINERQPLAVVEILRRALGSLSGKTVALLGVAFKPDTDDVRETRALPLYRALKANGARVVCWDPFALENFRRLLGEPVESETDLRQALSGADAALIQTEWKALRELPPQEWKRHLRTPIVVDGRRGVDGKSFDAAGVRYFAVGWPNRFS